MKLRELSLWSAAAGVLALFGVGLGVVALAGANPYQGMMGITVVCAGGVVALIGLQDK